MHDTSPPSTPPHWTLSDLTLAARLTIAAFLLSVGLGYLAALVNLHLAEASPGEALPTDDDVIRVYSGKSKTSQFERVLVAHPSLPFNGGGSMRRVFVGGDKASRWKATVKRTAKRLDLDLNDPKQVMEAEVAAQKELDGERLTLVAWAREGFSQKAYDDDAFARPRDLIGHPIEPKYLNENNSVKLHKIITDRCVSCHDPDVGGAAARMPLKTFEDITNYTSIEKGTGASLSKLALTTHVHLLGFAMLYGLTGLALALSSVPAWIRVPVAPLALVAQVVDISFWWLGRMEEPYGPMFSTWIRISGGIVGAALGLQIILTTFSMFRILGKVILVLLFIAAAGGGHFVKEKFIDPYLLAEKKMMKAVEKSPGE